MSSRYLCVIMLLIFSVLNLNAQNKYYKDLVLDKNEDFLVYQGDSIKSLTVEARVAVSTNKETQGKSKSNWRLLWNYISNDTYNFIEFGWQNTDFGDIYDQRQVIITIASVLHGKETIEKKVFLSDGVSMSNGYNTILLEIKANLYNVFVGAEQLNYVGSFNFVGSILGKCGVQTSVLSTVAHFIVEPSLDIKKKIKTQYTYEILKDIFSYKKDTNEGFWNYLDRDNNPQWARIGGRYRLALLSQGEDFLLLYIDGAEVNKSQWNECMVKGRLKATNFENHYDVEWYDSTFELIKKDIYANIDNSILTIHFPIYKSSVRFYKE